MIQELTMLSEEDDKSCLIIRKERADPPSNGTIVLTFISPETLTGSQTATVGNSTTLASSASGKFVSAVVLACKDQYCYFYLTET